MILKLVIIKLSFFFSVGELEAALEMSPDKFKSLYGSEQPESEDDIVFGCYSGIRSLTALILARQLGFEKLVDYDIFCCSMAV